MSPKVTANKSMDDRIKEFRSDPEKMHVTTKFVDEVVEKAKSEALRRMKQREKEARMHQSRLEGDGRRKRGRWHSRARGFFSRIFGSLCFCSTETHV